MWRQKDQEFKGSLSYSELDSGLSETLCQKTKTKTHNPVLHGPSPMLREPLLDVNPTTESAFHHLLPSDL